MLECPDCERPFSGKRCRCGWEAPTATKAKPSGGLMWPRTCAITPCQLEPEVWNGGRPICGWHLACRGDHVIAQSYEAFEAYCLELRRRHYCCTFTHMPPPWLWKLIQGTIPQWREPSPCAQGGCPYRSEQAVGTSEVQEARQELRQLLPRIGAAKEKAAGVRPEADLAASPW